MEYLMNLDEKLLLLIQETMRSVQLTPIFTAITRLGDNGFIWILLSLCLLIPKKTRKIGIMSFLALGSSFVVNNLILKNVIRRVRPYDVIHGLSALIEKQHDFSFPSGHTASSFAAAIILYQKLPKKYGCAAILLAILIAFSRLYLGVHYPSDVIVGAISGSCIGLIVSCIVDAKSKRPMLK